MGFKFWTVFVCVLVFFAAVQARPGQLKEQRYEFQEFQSNSYNEHVGSSPPVSARLEEIPWSQQHPNEVNAFAEVFRQQYNQMVEYNNRMMQMHQQTMSNFFRPVTYELYHIPNAQSFSNFFGNQQQYVQNQAVQMTQQLVHNLQQGTVTQQDLMNPEFFVNQAASELDRVHQPHHISETSDIHLNSDHQEYELQQQHGALDHNDEQQQYEPVFVEADQHTIARDQHGGDGDFSQTGSLKKILVYNSETNSYEYVYVNSVDQVAAQSDNQHMHQTSYIQSLPPVQFNNARVTNLDHEVEAVEVHTPVSIEIPKSNRQFTQQQQQSTIQTTADEYYGSTYDQQPIYDLRFLDSVSTTNTPPRYRVISLERKKVNTTPPQSSSTTTTTTVKPETVKPTTESSVMSMLPHKKQPVNYTEVYHKVREELNKHMQKEAETANEETHFMGMTSNKEQTKLQYDTESRETATTEVGRGDQPSFGDDYVSEEQVESEPGIGYYPVDTTPSSTTSVPSIVENNFRTSSAKPVRANQSPHYQAPLAPFPTTTTTTTTKPKSNPYYSAPLAPFPSAISTVSSDDQNLLNHQYAQFSEIENMNQETQTITQVVVPAFAVANVVQDRNEQHFFDEQHHAHQFEEQFAQDYDDTQQFETFQQTSIDLGQQAVNFQDLTVADSNQPSEQFAPTAAVVAHHQEEVPAHVMELTTAPTTIPNATKKGWFQKQWSKLKHTFQN